MEIKIVNSDSPAWHSGLKFGDVILEIESRPINNIKDYK